MKRHPVLQDFCDQLAKNLGGQSLTDAQKNVNAPTCVFCKKPAHLFKDEISRKEYTISGLCQICQDATFVDGDE